MLLLCVCVCTRVCERMCVCVHVCLRVCLQPPGRGLCFRIYRLCWAGLPWCAPAPLSAPPGRVLRAFPPLRLLGLWLQLRIKGCWGAGGGTGRRGHR